MLPTLSVTTRFGLCIDGNTSHTTHSIRNSNVVIHGSGSALKQTDEALGPKELVIHGRLSRAPVHDPDTEVVVYMP